MEGDAKMTLQEILTYWGITPTGGIIIIVFTISGLLEVSKIKINPWSAIAQWLRNFLLKETNEAIKEMRETQKKIQNDLAEHIAQSHRQVVIDFTTECMNGQRHTQEQFNYVFKSYRYYEEYVKDNDLTNDEVNESIEYIRHIYQKCLDEGDFER